MTQIDMGQLPDIDETEVSGSELFKSIDYTRPLSDYATASDIADFMKRRTRFYDRVSLAPKRGCRIIQDDMEKYLQNEAYSSSCLKEVLKSPLHLFFERESGWKEKLRKVQKEKECFTFGTFVHSCILEPRKFSLVVVEPDYSQTTTEGMNNLISFWEDMSVGKKGHKAVELAKSLVDGMGLSIKKIDGKRAYYSQLKRLSGLVSIGEADKIKIDAVRFNFERYGGGMLPELMQGAKTEVSIYATDPVTGLDVRIRPDGIQFAENIGRNAIISVKSTSCESLGHFYYQTAKYDFELSEGMYLDVAGMATGRDFTATIMVMVQSVPPFGVAVLVWDGEDLEIGKYKYRKALQDVADCKTSGKYPGFEIFAEADNLGLINMKQPLWNAKELFPTCVDD